MLVYFLVRRLVPQLNDNIPDDKVAPAVVLAATPLAAGTVSTACLTC